MPVPSTVLVPSLLPVPTAPPTRSIQLSIPYKFMQSPHVVSIVTELNRERNERKQGEGCLTYLRCRERPSRARSRGRTCLIMIRAISILSHSAPGQSWLLLCCRVWYGRQVYEHSVIARGKLGHIASPRNGMEKAWNFLERFFLLSFFGVRGRYGTDAVRVPVYFRQSWISAEVGLVRLPFAVLLGGWRFGGLRAYSLARLASS